MTLTDTFRVDNFVSFVIGLVVGIVIGWVVVSAQSYFHEMEREKWESQKVDGYKGPTVAKPKSLPLPVPSNRWPSDDQLFANVARKAPPDTWHDEEDYGV